MMGKFKVGDKVRRVDNPYSSMAVDTVVTVSEVFNRGTYIKVAEAGHNLMYVTDCFVLEQRPRPHAELIKQWAEDDSLVIEGRQRFGDWKEVDPLWWPDWEYRIKPEVDVEALKADHERVLSHIEDLSERQKRAAEALRVACQQRDGLEKQIREAS
ncbi:hypothetical protein [Microbulbifer discodermiae]|uniref:hypothetical protein n=1 Tax=Microbulbifer sp. 2201CG32-9 TaxID=3232309 RepID=UPI00345BD847